VRGDNPIPEGSEVDPLAPHSLISTLAPKFWELSKVSSV